MVPPRITYQADAPARCDSKESRTLEELSIQSKLTRLQEEIVKRKYLHIRFPGNED
jgi:hypothetical protein